MSIERPFRPIRGVALVLSQGGAARLAKLGEEPAPRPAGGWTFGLQSR